MDNEMHNPNIETHNPAQEIFDLLKGVEVANSAYQFDAREVEHYGRDINAVAAERVAIQLGYFISKAMANGLTCKTVPPAIPDRGADTRFELRVAVIPEAVLNKLGNLAKELPNVVVPRSTGYDSPRIAIEFALKNGGAASFLQLWQNKAWRAIDEHFPLYKHFVATRGDD